MLAEALSYSFFQRALLAAVLASLACGLIGSFVVLKRMSSISGGLSHAAFGGVGIGYYFGFNPLLAASGFGVLSGLLIGVVYLKYRQGLDSIVAIVWSVGMALGVMLVSLTPGYAPDLNSYLFGSILLVAPDYVYALLVLDILIFSLFAMLYKHFQAISFDQEFCEVSGVSHKPLFLLLMLLTSLTVVMLMRVVGAILLISLLSIPSVIALQWSESFKRVMLLASSISVFATVSGLFLSYYLSTAYALNAATGPLIILLCALMYLGSLALKSKSLR